MQTQLTRLKPTSPDLLVRKEDGSGMLNAEGEAVLMSSYWRRRISDGDVVLMGESPAPTDDAKKAK